MNTEPTLQRLPLLAMLFAGLINPTFSAQLDIYPGIEFGIMHYELSQEPFYIEDQSHAGTNDRFRVADDIPYLRGKMLIFVDDFFIDLYGLYSLTGQTSANQKNALYNISNDSVMKEQSDLEYDAEFYRSELGFTAGYSFQSISFFAGYKLASTNIDYETYGIRSEFTSNSVSPIYSYTLNGNRSIDLTEQGPFVGAFYGWDFDNKISGRLVLSLAIAYLDSEFTYRQGTTRLIALASGEERLVGAFTEEHTGHTTGLNIGLDWHGNIKANLAYYIGFKAYRYDFNADGRALGNFVEEAYFVRAGLNWKF